VSDTITPQQFHDTVSGDDWRVVFAGARANFRSDSLSTSVALVDAIGRLDAAVDHPPEIDVRSAGVVITTRSDVIGSLTTRDVRLARQVSSAARELGLVADPATVQAVQLTIDALVPAEVIPFWAALLGYDAVGEPEVEDLVDPRRQGPPIWIQRMDAPRPQRNRIHVDVSLPPELAERRIAGGGRMVNDTHAPMWWTLADPEGNEADAPPGSAGTEPPPGSAVPQPLLDRSTATIRVGRIVTTTRSPPGPSICRTSTPPYLAPTFSAN
jgi:4a-hydroxytetrahydrobiopterin dehydratase